MNEYFIAEFEKKLSPLLKYLNAQRINKLDGYINPQYLYFLDQSLWFSCSYDWKDHILEVSLGRLFQFRDVMPRIIVLEDYTLFLAELLNEGFISKKSIKHFNSVDEGINTIAKTLLLILTSYKQIHSNIIEKVKMKEKRLQSYLIKEIFDLEMLHQETM